MFDFRLKVFLTVAQRLSFTKAAAELFISQPAVSKHIKEIEKYYQSAMFERNGNRLNLTPQGLLLQQYATQVFALYQEMDSEIRFQNEKHFGQLTLGSSTTAAQYVLPQFLAELKASYPLIFLYLQINNTEGIENLLLDHQIDIGIVEGSSKHQGFNYRPFLKDEIVLCTHSSTPIAPILRVEQLKNLAFIIRESGSGTLEIIRNSLLEQNLKLEDLSVEMVLDNNESIKSYLENSQAFAFLSLSAIYKELENNELKIIEVENLNMERYYYSITRKETQNPLVSLFLKKLHHNL